MKISLKDWKQVEAAFRDVRKAVETADAVVFTAAAKYKFETPEGALLKKLWEELHELRQTLRTTAELHPQSEWLGGDSDNPQNHVLREPNICPLPRRRFTPEEITEAGAVCHGPVQWTFHANTTTPSPAP